MLLSNLQVDGLNALPIIGLLSFLMGIVIAYQGSEQLKTFGANIFIVDLVGISLLREIAPLVTAILVAGRSGSAYTAQIGTMTVTEELDALRSLGISPMSLLVIPRALALVIALPLLTVFADAVGVFGGMLIALSQLGVTFTRISQPLRVRDCLAPLPHRHRQDPGLRRHHRASRLLPGVPGFRRRRQRRPPHHHQRRPSDLFGHRHRRLLFDSFQLVGNMNSAVNERSARSR